MSTPGSPQAGADRNLLFGILALQLDFVTRDALIQAMNAWVLDKSKSLGRILIDQKALVPDRHTLLEALVQEHLKQHSNDPEKSLAALSSIGSVREQLQALKDPALEATLSHVTRKEAELSTIDTSSPGTPTSAGGRFRILRPHARGGLGEVLLARDEELHREVALKQIQEVHADNPQSRSRFILEAEITGGLEHPGIVPVYGLGTYADGRPFYAMRFIRGDSLRDAIASYHAAADGNSSERALAFRELLGRFVDVCNAIAYAHSRGVLHRDLKPGNIMLGQYGETLVVDWGLAKPVGRAETSNGPETTLRPPSTNSSSPTIAGAALGTPAYMSPEQAAGNLNEIGPASDVYSLGATFYCLLTGKPPLDQTDVATAVLCVQTGRISRPRDVKPEVPPALDAICCKAMSLKPADRYPSPRDLADDIEHWLADEPVSAYAEPVLSRIHRWSRKHRPIVTGAAALLVTAVVALSVGSVLLTQSNGRTRAERDRAQANFAEAERQRDQAVQQRKRAEQAEQLAKLNEAKAQASAAESKAVLDFFQNKVVAAARPKSQAGGLGTNATVRAVLDAAMPLIGKDFAGQPIVEATIRDAVGSSYVYLGAPKLAIEQFERALSVRSASLGRDDPETLGTMHHLAVAYTRAGRPKEAIALHEEALKWRRSRLGPHHPDTLTTMSNLGAAYWDAGRRPEALALFEETLKLRERYLAPDDPQTLQSMHVLSKYYTDTGRWAEAIALGKETLSRRQKKLGPNDPDTLWTMNNLAVSYAGAGGLADALALDKETFKLRQAELGPDHPDTLQSMANLASLYRQSGQFTEAIALNEETLGLRKAKLGPDHPDTLWSMNNLANAYNEAGRFAEAISLHEAILKIRQAKLGSDHPDTLASMDNLAEDYFDAGRLAESLTLYEELVKGARAKLGLTDPVTLDALCGVGNVRMARQDYAGAELMLTEAMAAADQHDPLMAADVRALLADCFLRQKKSKEAEALLRACLGIREKQGAKGWQQEWARSLLGGCLTDEQRYAEAEPLLLAGYRGLKESQNIMPVPDRAKVNDARDRLVHLYDAWNKKDKADKWRTDASTKKR
jgi:serine/threonine protein kinase/tetratricopeptide (TPR) repeat protein